MTTTARRRDPDDDIAAIAKQISDQAEAIYQNWKSRGLAPADLISCHAAGDTSKLGSMLKPQPSAKPAAIELLAQAPTMDNNRLEKLVKNFVDEDKARIAAARNKSAMPSSIQYALQKFENKGTSQTDGTNLGSSIGNVGYARKAAPLSDRKIGSGYGSGANVTSLSEANTFSSTNSVQEVTQGKPSIGQKPQISPKPRLGDTIEMTLPQDLTTTGLQTWPLKHRIISKDTIKKTNELSSTINHQYSSLKLSSNNTTIDRQVALEEEKLINALKNGDVVSEDPSRHSVTEIRENDREIMHQRFGISRQPIQPQQQVQPHQVHQQPHQVQPQHHQVQPQHHAQPASQQQYPQPPTQLMNNLKDSATIERPTTSQPPSEPQSSVAALSTKWGLRSTPRRPVEQQVPHPELTISQRQHLRQTQAANPVRPFLTRGSVAERVLIFERCPSDLLLDKRVRSPAQHLLTKPQPSPKQPSLQHTTLQRHVKAHRNVNIPRFHFPTGKPTPPGQQDIIRAAIASVFTKIGKRAVREDFATLTQACQLPLYWKTPLYLAVCAEKTSCSMEQFITFWQNMTSQCHDAASRFVYILTRGRRTWLVPEDFIPMVQDVVETHPGLTFLKEATEFHSRYVHTVIARVYYNVNRSWSSRITIPEIRRSNLLSIIQLLEEEEDINQITQYFSYEHFYVIYCKFWELDRDHDLFIDKQDLTRHNDHALSTRIIDRIFSGCVTRGNKKQKEERMSYTDFVWFLLSEEDKRHPTAIEYWFRCMDLDGDGFLSMYELEYFYEEQMHRMEAIGIETLPFQDCLCQMLDMVKPKTPGRVALSDLKNCKMTPIFFDTFFNLEKYLDHEQRDPFASQRDHDIDGQEMSDWDRYAAEEYELLVAEEGGNDQADSLSFDEGNEEDLLSQHLDGVLDDDQAELSEESDEGSI